MNAENRSIAAEWAAALVARYGEQAHEVYDRLLDSLSVVDGAGLAENWALWARPKQLPPASRHWRRWGFLTGRGFGKTLADSKEINATIERSPTPLLVLLVAQDEQSAVDIQVHGPSGLIATAAPWNRPQWEASALQLVWPNGSRAYVRTPEVPGKIRGLEYHLAWCSELQSWPTATRDEAWTCVIVSTRLGDARVIWDSTPKRKHPILRQLLDEHAADPNQYCVVRGTTHENPHLPLGYREDLERKWGGTSRGREELYGEILDEAENALIKQAWIDAARRRLPDTLTRKALGVDPAITTRAGSDRTGIIAAGAGPDGQAYVLGDFSGKHAPHEWAEIVLDWYVDNACDVVIVETNKGGDLVTRNLRASADARQLRITVVGKDERPRYVKGNVYVKETHSRGAKEDRAQPLATAYERGRVSHPHGVDLGSLEDTLTTWEPGGKTADGSKSPDQLDAEVLAVTEVLGLAHDKPDPKRGFTGIEAAQQALSQRRPAVPVSGLSMLLSPGSRSRI